MHLKKQFNQNPFFDGSSFHSSCADETIFSKYITNNLENIRNKDNKDTFMRKIQKIKAQ